MYQPVRPALQSGTTVYIGFPESRPADWLQFLPGAINIYMTADQYDDVYHILQTEHPAFCTALDLEGLQIGACTPSSTSASASQQPPDTGNTAWKRSSSAPKPSRPVTPWLKRMREAARWLPAPLPDRL